MEIKIPKYISDEKKQNISTALDETVSIKCLVERSRDLFDCESEIKKLRHW